MLPVRPHGSALCPLLLNCLPLIAASMRSVHQVTPGASAVRWFERAPQRGPLHTRQWIGTHGNRGNGEYRDELASALRAITTYLTGFAFPQRWHWFVWTDSMVMHQWWPRSCLQTFMW